MLLHSVVRSEMSCPPPRRSVNEAPRACLEPLEDRRLLSGSPQTDVAASANAEKLSRRPLSNSSTFYERLRPPIGTAQP